MGYRTKQRILNRLNSNGQKTFNEIFNILSHREMKIKTNSRVHLLSDRMASIKITSDGSCRRGSEMRGTLLHCWWECKLVQPLWKPGWWFHRKTGTDLLPQDPAIPLLGIYPKDASSYYRNTWSTMFIAVLIIIVGNMETT